jgi:hypothetical protein
MAIGKFGNKAATPAAATAARKPVARPAPERVSKYADAGEPGDMRDPLPVPGDYRVRVLECEDNPSPKNKSISWFKAKLEILALEGPEAEQAHRIGDVVGFLQQTAGNGADQGVPRVVAFVRNAAGYETYEEYKAFDPKGYFVDTVGGIASEYSERGETIVGRIVDTRVTRGRPTKDGNDYYREHAWSVVSDDEQDEVGKVGEA